MADIIHTFAEPFVFDDLPFAVRVVGRPAGTVWEGWLEFVAPDDEVFVTPRETTQPDRRALEYWASGLSPTYFEGAYRRAQEAEDLEDEDAELSLAEAAPLPAPAEGPAGTPFDPPAGAVLDPYSVAAQGEEILRSELHALSGWHLRNIVRAYRLAGDEVDLESLPQTELVELIVDAVALG